jgi:activator of HSP90 ATPase
LTDERQRMTEAKRGEIIVSDAIHKEVDFKASPQQVYEALLDAKQFSAFSGAAAEIQREAGGAFSCFDGFISGRNIELAAHRRIVQAWRVKIWPGVLLDRHIRVACEGFRYSPDHGA